MQLKTSSYRASQNLCSRQLRMVNNEIEINKEAAFIYSFIHLLINLFILSHFIINMTAVSIYACIFVLFVHLNFSL